MQLIKNFINRISYSFRHKKALEKFNAKIQKYQLMSDSEIEMRYIETATKCECGKLKLATFVGIIFVSLIMGLLEYLLEKSEQLVMIFLSSSGINDSSKVSLLVIILLCLVVLFTLGLIIIDTFNQIKKNLQEKLFIEEFKKNHRKW